MSKIQNAFQNGKAFIGFLTAGDPTADKTVEYILAMEQAGADLIEIGIPFSDPTAEGPVIQDANIRALTGGMNLNGVFSIVHKVRQKTSLPLVFLTYANPVFFYGYDRFFSRCEEEGVDGVILPDMPYEEKGELLPAAKAHGVDVISMIAPTSKERVRMIAKEAAGFLYLVSSMGVTGTRDSFSTDLRQIVQEIRSVSSTPVAVGFGIHTPEQAKEMAAVSDGAIVGSAIVKIIAQYGENAAKPLSDYVRAMKNAVAAAE